MIKCCINPPSNLAHEFKIAVICVAELINQMGIVIVRNLSEEASMMNVEL
jgi:hypothetical protein